MSDKSSGPVIRVLGFQDEDCGGMWCALGLEVDIRGYGRTFREACAEFEDLLDAQIDAALEKDLPDMVFYPAEEKYFRAYEEAIEQSIRQAAFARAKKASEGLFPWLRRKSIQDIEQAAGPRYEVSSTAIPIAACA